MAFVLALRVILALLVPLSGAAVMRAWFGERRVASAAAGGGVLGLAAFWLALRVLAPLLSFSAATWLAFSLVVGAGAIALLTRRRRQRGAWEPEASRTTLVLLGAFAVLVGLAVYSASGALLKFGETMTHHVPLVASIQRGNFPPIDLREPPYPLEYHWGQHLLAAGVAELSGCEPYVALFATNAILASFAFALAFSLVRREAGAFPAALAAILMVAGGTLNWLSASHHVATGRDFWDLMYPFALPFSTGNVLVGGFHWRLHVNSTTWPVCLLLLGVDFAWSGAREVTPTRLVASALLIAQVAPGSETMLCAAVVGLMGAALVSRFGAGPLSGRRAALVLAVAVAAALLSPLMGGVLRSFLESGSASHRAAIVLNVEHFGSVPSWNFGRYFKDPPWIPILSLRFLQDAGPVPFLLVPALLWSLWRGSRRIVTVAMMALAALAAATSLTLTEYPANTFRLVNHAVVLGALPVGALLGELCERPKALAARVAGRAIVVALVAFLTAAWPLAQVGLYAARRKVTWPTDAEASAMYDLGAISWLRSHTDYREGALALPTHRSDILGAGQVAPLGSYVGGHAEFRGAALAAAKRLDVAALSKLGVRYLYVVRNKLDEGSRGRIDEAVAEGRLTVRWHNSKRARTLYEIITKDGPAP